MHQEIFLRFCELIGVPAYRLMLVSGESCSKSQQFITVHKTCLLRKSPYIFFKLCAQGSSLRHAIVESQEGIIDSGRISSSPGGNATAPYVSCALAEEIRENSLSPFPFMPRAIAWDCIKILPIFLGWLILRAAVQGTSVEPNQLAYSSRERQSLTCLGFGTLSGGLDLGFIEQV